ncbi:MAG: hypothetical protein P8130_03705 [Deltaproteobacteria bacterium]
MKKVLIGIGVLLVIAAVAITLVVENLGTLIKKGIETAGPAILQAEVKVDKVAISLSSGSGELDGFMVGNPAGFTTPYAFDMDRIKIQLDPKSLTTDTVHIKQILIEGPRINYEGAIGKSNLNQLQANAEAYIAKRGGSKEKVAKKGKPGKTVIIDSLKITGGEASLSMNLLQGKKVTVPLPVIEMKDIGKEQETSFAGVLKAVLAEVNRSLVPVIQSKLSNLALPGALQQGTSKVQQETQKGLDKFKGILGK